MTRTIVVDPCAVSREALDEAAAVLRGGGLVVFPTESFYGLGADARNPQAIARVFSVKRRPGAKPLLVLVASIAMVETLVTDLPGGARDLMTRHWPGPLTLVLKAEAGLPSALTAGTDTVGVRMPGHPIALALVRAAGFPVTAPSANPSDEPPPTTALAARRYFEERVELILDGGPTAGGAGSTIVDCTAWPPRVLRHGPVEV